MSFIRFGSRVRTTLLAAALCSPVLQDARADELVEWLFWNEIGNAVGAAAQSYADYQQERQLWRDNIAAAKAELARCGGCASAQAELDKWQGIENRFQEVAGELALATGMPPSVAKFLDIDIPLAPYRSPEERAKECEIVRRDWVGQRSEFCQSKVDQYLSCLRDFERRIGVCTADAAKVPGGECWEEFSFYEPCHDEDYAAVEREREKQEARAAGAIIPDHARYATSAIVVYGRVPDDFLPQLPPADIVVGTLDEEQTREVKFRMRKEREGALRQITVKYFHWSDVEPRSQCFDSGRPTEEIALRICEDLSEMSFRHHPPLLTCEYVSQRAGLTGDAIYWYGSRPETPLANPAHLLQRSQAHPLLQIGEPRTDCPATLEEAKELYARYRSTLGSLGVQEVPATVALRSDWQRQRQAEYDAGIKAEMERRLAAFPIEGSFDATIEHPTGRKDRAECTIKRIDEQQLRFTCTNRRGSVSEATGTIIEGGRIVVRWSPELEVAYEVISDNPPLLRGGLADSEIAYHQLLHRTGDLSAASVAHRMASFPLEGSYELELSTGGQSMTILCTITRDSRYIPHRFPVICTTPDGQAFTSEGIPDRGDSVTLRFASWRPTWTQLNGKPVTGLSFPIDPSQTDKDTPSILSGTADNSVSARLVRADPTALPPTGTPLEELPGLKRGGYAISLPQKGITSLEQLAALSDDDAKALAAGLVWYRDRAREFLKTKTGETAPSATAVQREAAALGDQSVPPDARSSAQPERSAAADPDSAVEQGSAGSACTVERIAGTYRTTWGDIACKPAGNVLECCHGGARCQKILYLELMPDGRNLVGRWEQQNGIEGPAEFGITDNCELTHGRWGNPQKPANRAWNVAGRK